MDLRLLLAACLTLALALGAGSGRAAAAAPPVDAQEAIAIAREDPVAIDQAAKNPELERRARLVDGRWQVALYADRSTDAERVGLVVVDATSGEVVESWSGYQVAWKMARGYSGAFGRKLNAPYVFIPLCLIFFAGLFDWRRPARIAHLDLLALLGFGLSHIFFNRAEIGISVPLAYPFLIYLALRLAWIGFRGPPRRGGLSPRWPTTWLLICLLFLVGFRVGLNLVNSGVADIGYASVVGADRIASGREVYGNFPGDVSEGDTYGPVTYYAYLPFELALPWSGSWDQLPAAHAAAICFDLGTLILLFLLGARIRPGPGGRRLGVILAFGWAAYPYTAFTLLANSNDALVALLVTAALLLGSRPAARGAVTALAVGAKFAPLVALPILARHQSSPAGTPGPRGRDRRPHRAMALFALGFGIVTVAAMAQTVLGPGLATFYERTLGYQAGRDSPFSIWGQAPGLGPLRLALAAAVALAAAAMLRWPRRPSTVQVAALTGALLAGTQLVAMHWFYLYLVWIVPAALVAFSAGGVALAGAFSSARAPATSPARSIPPARQGGSQPAPP